MIYLQLFWNFFKTGLFAVGGGLSTIPFLYELSEKTAWFDTSTLTDMIAVSESTPGPLGVNMATYVGFHTAGFWGSLAAGAGIIMPSFVIILVIAVFLKNFREKRIVKTLMYVLRSAVIGLLLYSFYKIAAVSFFDSLNHFSVLSFIFFAILVFLIVFFKKVHPIVWISVGAVLGLIFL